MPSIFRRFSNSARLGDLLVQAGILTPAQLQEVVKNSRSKKLQMGQVLVMSGLLTPKDLQIVLEAQSMLRDRTIDLNLAVQCIKVARKLGSNFSDVLEDYDQAAAQRARTGKLGELFIEAGIISQEDLSEAMERSVNTGMPLGRVLVLNKVISGEVLQKGLDVQLRLRDEVISREEALVELRRIVGLGEDAEPAAMAQEKKQPVVRLGELLVMSGILNETDVMDALEWGLANQQPIGNVLVSQELISKELLDAALFFQSAVKEGKVDAMKACECLSEVFSTGISMEEALEEAAPSKPREEPKEAPISYQQLLTRARVVTDEDIDKAFDKDTHTAAFIGKVLVLCGQFDVPTLQSTLRCYQMIAKGYLSPDDAIAALDYCLHHDPDAPISFEQALRDLQWNPETGLKLRGERSATTASSTKISAVKATKPAAEPAEEVAPAAEKAEDEDARDEPSAKDEPVRSKPAAGRGLSGLFDDDEEPEETSTVESAIKTTAELDTANSGEFELKKKSLSELLDMEDKEPASSKETVVEENEKLSNESSQEDETSASENEEDEPEAKEVKGPEDEHSAFPAPATKDEEPEEAEEETAEATAAESASAKDEGGLASALKSLYNDASISQKPAEKQDNGSKTSEPAESASSGGLKELLKGLIATPLDSKPSENPAAEVATPAETPALKAEKTSKVESKAEAPRADAGSTGKSAPAPARKKEMEEIENIAGMSAEQLLVEIMKSATNPELGTKRAGRFSETILPEDAKARQLAKLLGKESSKELAEKLSFEKQDENTDALDTAFSRLAETYFEQGNYKEAQIIYERMLVHRLNDLGPDNPLLVEDYNNLAMTLCVQGRFDKAEPFMKRAVHLYESVQENKQNLVEHADYLHSLGTIEYKLEKFKEAEELMLHVVQLRREGLPEDHEDMGRALADYAKVLKKLGKNESAETIYKKAREILSKQNE